MNPPQAGRFRRYGYEIWQEASVSRHRRQRHGKRQKVQIPKGFPFAGTKFGSADIQLIVGGQTEIPIRDVSVSEGMKQALNNIDAYLGAMAQTQNPLFGVRVWVLVPKVLQTNFRYKEGWGIEGTFITKLPEWDLSSKGVEPVVQAVSLRTGRSLQSCWLQIRLMRSPAAVETLRDHGIRRCGRNAVYPAGI